MPTLTNYSPNRKKDRQKQKETGNAPLPQKKREIDINMVSIAGKCIHFQAT